jgi:REP element-mobilizing transposase RayT
MGPEHGKRRAFRKLPVHVTMRMRHDVRANLRQGKLYHQARRVLRETRKHLRCRIVHFALIGNHLHLIVEAADGDALKAAMKGFAVRMARKVNGFLDDLARRHGLARPTGSRQVFAFRYDAHVRGHPLMRTNGQWCARATGCSRPAGESTGCSIPAMSRG